MIRETEARQKTRNRCPLSSHGSLIGGLGAASRINFMPGVYMHLVSPALASPVAFQPSSRGGTAAVAIHAVSGRMDRHASLAKTSSIGKPRRVPINSASDQAAFDCSVISGSDAGRRANISSRARSAITAPRSLRFSHSAASEAVRASPSLTVASA